MMPETHTEEFRQWLVPYVRAWARHNIHFGCVSWTSPRWAGIFNTACLSIESAHPSRVAVLRQIERHLADGFRVTVEVASEHMMYRFPYGYHDAAKRGEVNDRFLDAAAIEEEVLPAVGLLGSHVSVVLLRVGHVYPTEGLSLDAFLRVLDRCLGALPRTHRYAVEIRNPEYLYPEYFACLRGHGAAHVLSHDARGLPLLDQVRIPGVFTTDVAVLRTPHGAGAPGGRDAPCGVAVRADDAMRLGVIEAVRQCIDEKKTLYVYMSDDAEGCAPLSVAALMTMLNADLAKRSVLKKQAA
jgi:hypothetical protein